MGQQFRVPASVDFPALLQSGRHVFVIRKCDGRRGVSQGLAYFAGKRTVELASGNRMWKQRVEVYSLKDPVGRFRDVSSRMSPPLGYLDIVHKQDGFNTRRTVPHGRHTKRMSADSPYELLLDALVNGSPFAREIVEAWRTR